MSNWRVFSESQDEELQPEPEFEFPLSQLPIQPFMPLSLAPPLGHPQEDAGPSRPPKQPRMEQRWHGNLQRDARALVILLQVGCVEPGSREVTFEGSFEGLNDDQFYCCLKPIKGNRGHQRWLEGPVNSLAKADRADYVAATVRRILKFLQME